MTFAAELDNRRQEVRLGSNVGGVVLWPKLDGQNVAIASPTPAPTAHVYKPDGQLSHQTTLLAEVVDGVSRLTASPFAQNFGLTAGENYRVDFAYTVGTSALVTSVQFDVVVEPWGTIEASLNDLVDEWADVASMLARQAELQADGRTSAQQAALLLVAATQDVRGWVKRKVEQEDGQWPLYVVNREELRGVVVARALYRAVVAQGLTNDAIAQLAAFWRKESEDRFAALPRLHYSSDDDKVADGEIGSWRSIRTQRSWA